MARRTLGLLALTLAACATPPGPPAPRAPGVTGLVATAGPVAPPVARDPEVGPHGEKASREGRAVRVVPASGPEILVPPAELHPASGNPALMAILPTTLLYLDDGTLLVGVGDGTVTALDAAGHRRWSLGFRGSIRGLAPAGRGLVAVTTDSGVVGLVGSAGQLLWERQVVDELFTPPVTGPGGVLLAAGPRGVVAFSPAGELVFSHAASLGDGCCTGEEQPLAVDAGGVVRIKHARFALGDPHPAIPSLTPVYPLRYRRVVADPATALVAAGPGVLLALAQDGKGRPELLRLEGDRVKRLPLPQRAAQTEVLGDSPRPQKPYLWMDKLVPRPGGDAWVLTRRVDRPREEWSYRLGPPTASGYVLEYHGGAVRERTDLFGFLGQHLLMENQELIAAPDAPARLLCFSTEEDSCASIEGGAPALVPIPGKIIGVNRVGETTWLTTDRGLFRDQGQAFQELPTPRDVWMRGVFGTGDRDLWIATRQSQTTFHHDGQGWTEHGVPISLEAGLAARAPDDVWSQTGRARWDGQRGSLVGGVPPTSGVVARGRDDVWLAGTAGVWHGTAPGPAVVRLPAATAADAGALPAAAPLPLGAPETGFLVKQVRFEETGKDPVTAARRLGASRDGSLLWAAGWDRLVEVDPAGRATTVLMAESGLAGRWFHPEGAGRGVVLTRKDAEPVNKRDQLGLLAGGAVAPAALQLDGHDAVAVDGDGHGVTWMVGTVTVETQYTLRGEHEHELGAHALVREGGGEPQPVLGLPSASFCDLAAAPDGGAWFAGALNPGPIGEGILFRARGRLGTASATRFRAQAALLAVAVVGPEEAWAVGAAGTVIHVVDGVATRYALASGAWLRAVGGVGPGDVWIGGDAGTLLHWDGRAFHPVPHPLGALATFTSVAAAHGAVWAAGPGGILELRRHP
jgi:hypothetical protein